jgi:hypothetical protein
VIFWFGPSDKNIRNSPWSTPPELIFVSFGSQESHLSNDAKISVCAVGHAELWIVLGWSKEQPWGTHGQSPWGSAHRAVDTRTITVSVCVLCFQPHTMCLMYSLSSVQHPFVIRLKPIPSLAFWVFFGVSFRSRFERRDPQDQGCFLGFGVFWVF